MLTVDLIEKYKGNTYKIELSDGSVYFWNVETVSNFHLKQGTKIPENAVEEIAAADLLRKARERALYLLDSRDHSFVELYGKLEKNYPEEICLEVVNKLASVGLVNDRRYAEKLAEKLIESKKLGYYRAKHEMLARGLDRELVEEMLAEYEEDTVTRLAALVEQKYAYKLTDAKSLQKVKNALARQGYSFSDINQVLEEYEIED